MIEARLISNASIRACRFTILLPSHYRADGTCRCDDVTHKGMRDWGYRWSRRNKRWEGRDDELASAYTRQFS